ncbi:MAG: M28 family metallopeptidase [Planctomycetes bacterium]|nr:M28 family metallopeptidase [Planctomycetota bacterium]
MTRSRSAPLGSAATIAALLIILTATPRSSDEALLKIDKRQPVAVPAADMAQMEVIQELANSWLVEVPSALASRLQVLGVSLEVLDPAPAGKVRYLVFAPSVDEISALAPLGTVWHVDTGVGLFSSRTELPREALPAGISLKLLSGPIRTPLSFQTPGLGRAVARPGEAQYQSPFDPRIAQMVSLVSSARLFDLIWGLESFQTRYTSTSNCEASGTSIHSYFRQLGLQAESDYFTFGAASYTTSNIIATIPGRVAPDRVVIVCAHYDSYSTQAKTVAPGADDNASGTAAVMEVARILAGYEFDFTIKLIGFSAEEWGLYGSKHYAQEAKQRGEQILGVINLDMIGYTDSLPEDLDIVVDGQSEWLGSRFVASANTYAPLLTLKVANASVRGSDHSPFWDQGYSALLGIEDVALKNPHCHKPTDTIETLNLAFANAVTRASIAAVAELAQPVSTPEAPGGILARSQTVSSLFTTRKTTVLTWNASRGDIAGYHVYRSLTPHGACQRANPSLISGTSYVDRFLPPDVSYYYVVTAIDRTGRESNYSVEVRDR